MARKQTTKYDAAAITPVEYGGLQEAYEHFNRALFGAGLPDVFITYQRKANSTGYFSPDRFSGRVSQFGKHELALNPDAFIGHSDEQIVQTLVHEMAHVWQHVSGKPGARGYDNKEWAAKMKAIGLQPTSTGMVGGKETGQHMSDYPIPDGPFTRSFADLAAAGWQLNLQSAHRSGGKRGTNSKTKFTCRSCGQNAWGKPDLAITCSPCGLAMVAEDVTTPVVEAMTSYDPEPVAVLPALVVESEPAPKPKRGRPKGSTKKPQVAAGAQSYDVKRPGKRLAAYLRKQRKVQEHLRAAALEAEGHADRRAAIPN